VPAGPFAQVPSPKLAARRGVGRLRRTRAELREAGSVRAWFFYLPGPGPWIMSWLRKRWTLFRNPHAHIEFRGPVYLGPGFNLHMPRGGTFIVGPGVEFRRHFRAELGPDARIEIGALCCFTHHVILSCDTSIVIEDRAILAQGVYVVDGNHRYRDLDKPIVDQGYDYRPLRIGAGALVLSKVTVVNDIGERAVIGANAVITKPIPPYCVAGGVPARVLEYYGPPGQEPPGFAVRQVGAEGS
jgi:acetyltransferase-like isoleucine patch superfamily enzyme